MFLFQLWHQWFSFVNLNKSRVRQFFQEHKDNLSWDAETVHFTTLVFRPVAYPQGITATLSFPPIHDFNPAQPWEPLPQVFQYISTTTSPYTVPLFTLTDCLVYSFKQNFCCRKCYSTKKPKQRNQVFWLEQVNCYNSICKYFLRLNISLVFTLLNTNVLEGPCSWIIQVVKDRKETYTKKRSKKNDLVATGKQILFLIFICIIRLSSILS